MDKIIQFEQIRVDSDKRTILNIPQASIPYNRITAIVGANGSGKTTLLKLIHGLIKPDSGSIHQKIALQRIALVLHHSPMLRCSVLQNLMLINDGPNRSDIQTGLQALKEIGLEKLANNSAQKLSAGERQKLVLARARLQQPDLILLDEPTANLDPQASQELENMMQSYSKEGRSIIFTSHQLAQVKRLADHVIFLDHGKIIENTGCDLFFNQPIHPLSQAFIQREYI
ncbi:MAG: ATP-binding cassette domain-containing protein [Polynucleobacter sp.]|jgi:tungstate transport system ATP-binding protein|nr:ATP-binding cassette domain-containing protein [Polynucleobacter sp.]